MYIGLKGGLALCPPLLYIVLKGLTRLEEFVTRALTSNHAIISTLSDISSLVGKRREIRGGYG